MGLAGFLTSKNAMCNVMQQGELAFAPSIWSYFFGIYTCMVHFYTAGKANAKTWLRSFRVLLMSSCCTLRFFAATLSKQTVTSILL